MKTFRGYTEGVSRIRSKVIYSKERGFQQQLIEDGWRRLDNVEDIIQDEIYGTADGLVKIVSTINGSGKGFWGRVVKPSHNQIKIGDVLSYDFDELFVGEGEDTSSWSIEGLKCDVLDTIRHKNIDKINTKPVVENKNIRSK